MLSAEELLAGSSLTYRVEVPPGILMPGDHAGKEQRGGTVVLRPLTVRDLQTVARAAKESDTLTATLMVQRALVEPEMSVAQVAALHVGLAQFLLQEINRISGITMTRQELTGAVEAPLAKAAFVLAREFGWTPDEVNNLTLGQMLMHVQMLKEHA